MLGNMFGKIDVFSNLGGRMAQDMYVHMSCMELPVMPCTMNMVTSRLNSHTLCSQQSTSMCSLLILITEALLATRMW